MKSIPERWYLIAACVAGWGIVLIDLASGGDGEHVDLLAILASTLTVICAFLQTRRRVERIFTHGYHAGYHDAAKAECCAPGIDCDVLVLSEERAKRAL